MKRPELRDMGVELVDAVDFVDLTSFVSLVSFVDLALRALRGTIAL